MSPSRTRWTELVLCVVPGAADEAAYLLTELGAAGAWQELGLEDRGSVELRSYVGASTSAREILAELERRMPGVLRAPALVRPLVERPWAELWKRYFKPRLVAPGVWVARPRARVAGAARGDVCVRIEPANAFGTGLHGSTRVCLRHLRRIVGSGSRASRVRSALDVGTGSGILAIAALKLGLERAVGVDADVESVLEARRNARRNGVASRLSLVAGGPEVVRGRFPLVLANLTAPTLAALADTLVERLEPVKGTLVVAGITRDEEQETLRVFARRGLTAGAALRDGDWSSFALRPRRRKPAQRGRR